MSNQPDPLFSLRIPVPVLQLDSELRIVHFNREAVDLMGIDKNFRRRRKLQSFFSESSRKALRGIRRELKKNEVIRDLELELLQNDRNMTIAVKLYIRRIENEANIAYSCAIIDLSRQKQTENELKNARVQAEIALQTKSNFLANLSHEIRTPMNAIIGFTEVLSKKISDENSLNFLRSIKSSGQALLKLINNILDLAKMESGKVDIVNSREDLQVLINEIKYIFNQKISDKGLQFIIQADESLPRSIYIDKTRLQQILINLISNAEKFTHIGYIRLAVSREDHELPNYVRLTFSVEDTGIGIEADQKEHIFEPFAQNDRQDSTLFGGTGLGLAIARHLAELMNGKLTVSSAPGRGSKFTLTLDKIRIAEEADMQPGENGISHDKPEIDNLHKADSEANISNISDRENELSEKKLDKKDLISLMIKSEVNEDLLLEKISTKLIASSSEKKELFELLSVLEKDIMPVWENVSRNNIITEIEDFSLLVADLANKYKHETLMDWSAALKKQLDEFDMEKFPETLGFFPRIVENIVEEIEDQ